MSDPTLLEDRLLRVLTLLERIPFRFADIPNNEQGLEHLDSICMVLIATGEELKKIDRQANGTLLTRYAHIPWSEVIGIRDFLAHHYFAIDPDQLFDLCQGDIP